MTALTNPTLRIRLHIHSNIALFLVSFTLNAGKQFLSNPKEKLGYNYAIHVIRHTTHRYIFRIHPQNIHGCIVFWLYYQVLWTHMIDLTISYRVASIVLGQYMIPPMTGQWCNPERYGQKRWFHNRNKHTKVWIMCINFAVSRIS